MVLIGVDYGRARTGFALARDGVVIPLEPLRTGDWKSIRSRLLDLFDEHSAELAILGLPLTAGGRETELTSEVRRLAELLAEAGVPVEFCPESGTTLEAERLLAEIPSRGSGRMKDSVAAAVLLKRYLGMP